MRELHLPWMELAIIIPMLGAIWVGRLRDSVDARKWALVFSGFALFSCVGAWEDFYAIHAIEANDPWNLLPQIAGRDLLVLDELSAPLVALAALLYFLTIVATLPTKMRRFSFAWTLVSESILLATYCCKIPWGVIGLLALGTVPPLLELRARGKPVRVYLLHMLAFILLMVIGWTFVEMEPGMRVHSLWAIVPLLGAIFIRCGIVPVHCWMTDLFEHATFGTALLFVTPMAGAYAALRLVLPIAPNWVLHSIGLISLTTAVYAAGMAFVQREGRRFFCYLFLSHSALVLVGLESVTPIGLTGALCVWLSVGLSLGGFGLTLRAMESRTGRLTLSSFHGLYEFTPTLATFFLLTGLASVGFPGTFGFVGTELLADGAVQLYPVVGVSVIAAATINGIAVLKVYFLIFTGTRHQASVSFRRRTRERLAVLTLAFLILGGGAFPQPGVTSRHHAAMELLNAREDHSTLPKKHVEDAPHDGGHDVTQLADAETTVASLKMPAKSLKARKATRIAEPHVAP